jgi:hypothetical protein
MLGNSGYSLEAEEALVLSSWPGRGRLSSHGPSSFAGRALGCFSRPICRSWRCGNSGSRPLDCAVGFSNRAVGRRWPATLSRRGAPSRFVGAALDRDFRAAERGAGFIETGGRRPGSQGPVRIAMAIAPAVRTRRRGGVRNSWPGPPRSRPAFFSMTRLPSARCLNASAGVGPCPQNCGSAALATSITRPPASPRSPPFAPATRRDRAAHRRAAARALRRRGEEAAVSLISASELVARESG